jgi:energy-coupling factor transport system substrate-specific component
LASERTMPRPVALPLPSVSTITFVLLNVLGLAAYLHPFLFAGTGEPSTEWFLRATDGPLIVAVVAALCLVLTIAELTSGGLNSKSLAALGVLAALAAVLRTLSLPAGANLYFFLIILGGYSFGPRTGFLLGSLSFFLSALVTGGVGPWLPFQMFAAAWMGLSAGLLRPLITAARFGWRAEVASLVLFGIVWGILFGVITNLWFWPFWVGGPDVSYQPGIGILEALRRYWNFYFLTSFGWDLLRSLANAIVLATLGRPLLKALLRFHDRFSWTPG